MPLDNITELRRRVPGGKYVLARALAERARQLQSGDRLPLVEVRHPNPLSVAIDETLQSKISFEIHPERPPSDEAPDELAAPETMEETLLAIGDQSSDALAPEAVDGAPVDAVIDEINS